MGGGVQKYAIASGGHEHNILTRKGSSFTYDVPKGQYSTREIYNRQSASTPSSLPILAITLADGCRRQGPLLTWPPHNAPICGLPGVVESFLSSMPPPIFIRGESRESQRHGRVLSRWFPVGQSFVPA